MGSYVLKKKWFSSKIRAWPVKTSLRGKKSKSGGESRRYAAKLLFQFRVVINGDSGKLRHCEERIINLTSHSATHALSLAKKQARLAQYHYRNSDGNPVYFEFIGVTDLLNLGAECDANEVWYDIRTMLQPMERKHKIVPPASKLNAIKWAE
jgi:hypothetical protein